MEKNQIKLGKKNFLLVYICTHTHRKLERLHIKMNYCSLDVTIIFFPKHLSSSQIFYSDH